ncbi:signal peptidase I [Enterococcus sp. DIV0724b]|uniref:signal peptidase I n=1 Tax=Enterococcus sp. DIV0724b TaxID=2774694 RepID=UPI003D2FC605
MSKKSINGHFTLNKTGTKTKSTSSANPLNDVRRSGHSNRKRKPQQKCPSGSIRKKQKSKNDHEMKKSHRKEKNIRRIKRILAELGISLALLSLLLYTLSVFTFSFAKVEGYSMVPTLSNGDWVFVNKLAKSKRFDLILYKDKKSKETSIRRVIGLPEEAISYQGDKLYVNNHEVYERFLKNELKRVKASKATFTEDWLPDIEYIPKGKYLILGDNRPYAADSREYGYIDEKEIIGVVKMRVLPIHQMKQF